MRYWRTGRVKNRWLGLRLPIIVCLSAAFQSDFPPFLRLLSFSGYRFSINATATGPVRQLRIEASRGSTLLTSFSAVTDGPVVGAQVADLDQNHFPELYVFMCSDGSGSFGRVYGWQFLTQRKAEIKSINWKLTDAAYMGHDSLWVENTVLCRRFPLYRPGDSNAQPTGGTRTIRYRLEPAGTNFILKEASIE